MRHSPLVIHLRLLLIGFHVLSGALQVALLFPLGGETGRQRLKRIWSRQLLELLGIRIEVINGGLGGIDNGLLVCNHVSFTDIFVLNALLPFGFVAKSDVAGWPLIGWLSRHNDTVFIERGSRKAAQRAAQAMRKVFAAGKRLVIFPEGTTTAGDRLLPFHAALFQSAIDATVPVHAICLSYRGADGLHSRAPAYIDDVSLLACIKTVLRTPELRVRVTLAARFVPPLADRRHLAAHTHRAVAPALAQTPAPTATPGHAGRDLRCPDQDSRTADPQSFGNAAAIRR